MIKTYPFLALIFLLQALPLLTVSQSLSDAEIKEIDALFQGYQDNHSPGYAIGIVKEDSLIFSKAYGYANLDYDIFWLGI